MDNQYIKPEILKNFHEALTDIIYDYFCYFRKDKTKLPNSTLVRLTRDATFQYLKHFMDIAMLMSPEGVDKDKFKEFMDDIREDE